MPLLAALDECNLAFTRIDKLARIALKYPRIQEGAMLMILAQCLETDMHIGDLVEIMEAVEILEDICPTTENPRNPQLF